MEQRNVETGDVAPADKDTGKVEVIDKAVASIQTDVKKEVVVYIPDYPVSHDLEPFG